VECITRVDTMGFWTGDAEQCSVSSATGARRATGGVLSGLAVLGAVALVLARRRR
jgi:MYXO-CTERM domain-containing protein